MNRVTVIGGGLAGCEAALQLASRNIPVKLIEMRPVVETPAHRTPFLAELVCSNSLKSVDPVTSSGVLKRELTALRCILLEAASRCSVPAGHALAVDRDMFAAEVTALIDASPFIELERREEPDLPSDGCVIVATGPLTSDKMSASIEEHFDGGKLFFYDAIAISLEAETIDESKVFRGSRYGKGGDDYLNVPLDEEGYSALIDFLLEAPKAEKRGFESGQCFDACLPVEVIAFRGAESLRYGPLKPRGLVDPRTGKEPHAVLQLRQEKRDGSLLGLVGFQTRLTRPAQKKLLTLLPGLEGANIARWGAIHRNTYLDSPRLLDEKQMSTGRDGLFFAGQIVGVEGYVESIAHGLLTAINASAWLDGKLVPLLPEDTMTGALQRYISGHEGSFQPMNANMRLLPPARGRKRERKIKKSERAAASFDRYLAENNLFTD
jgi:methylenetetrahydrofolate--tRNA-(uracil-5-)-methyltransferase